MRFIINLFIKNNYFELILFYVEIHRFIVSFMVICLLQNTRENECIVYDGTECNQSNSETLVYATLMPVTNIPVDDNILIDLGLVNDIVEESSFCVSVLFILLIA